MVTVKAKPCRVLEDLPRCPGFVTGRVFYATPGMLPKRWNVWEAAPGGTNPARPDFYTVNGSMAINVAEDKLARVGSLEVDLKMPE